MSGPQWLRPRWPAPSTVRAAFTLRGGGASRGGYAALNLGAHVGDDPLAVAHNRALLHAALALPAEPVWLEQQHGIRVADLDREGQPCAPADAALTRAPGRVCAVLVADCLPVLFAARDGSVVGAAHAGWRGLAAGVLEATVRAMGVPAGDLVAWLGPCIGPQHFEVGEDVRSVFLETDAGAAKAFRRGRGDRWWCDLPQLAQRRLAACGVGAVAADGSCTFTDRERCFSFRRDGQCGRMAALVWMAA